MTSEWKDNGNVYVSVEQKHDGELDLVIDICAEESPQSPFHQRTAIRRAANEELYPYDTEALYQWVQRSPTDPHSREQLDLVLPRIQQRFYWLQRFRDIKLCDVTVAFKVKCWQDYLQNRADPDIYQRARAFVDVATLEAAKCTSTMDYESCMKVLSSKPAKSWMVRKSSLHESQTFMKHAEIVVVGYRRANKIVQCRLLHVRGVGWFMTKQADYSSFRQFLSTSNCSVVPFLCLVDYVEGLISTNRIDVAHLLSFSS